MNNIQININHCRINLYGSNAIIEAEKSIIENLNITGNEYDDRLLIQKCIDENKLKSEILYDGNTVYPFEKTIKEFRKLQKSGSLEKLTKSMYHFFIYACGDIAHYDLHGFRAYYDDSFRNLENQLLKHCSIANWHSDLDRIFKELQIGKYFDERNYIDINKISINNLKSIIENCGWKVIKEDNSWKLQTNVMFIENFSFDIDISSNIVSDIVTEIQKFYNSFNANEYVENIIKNRENFSNSLTIKEIVLTADNIKSMLYKLASDVLYKCRLEAQEKSLNIEDSRNIKYENEELDLDMCG